MEDKIHIQKKVAIGFFMAIFIIASLSNAYADSINQIIGFGDSITSGRPYSDIIGGGRQGYGGYEPFLETMLADARRKSYVYNWGYGGETTPVGVNRIDSVLAIQESSFVLIMEGTNDEWFGVSATTTAFNLGVMVDKCRAHGTTPVLGNLTPADRDTSDQIPLVYNPLIANVAQQKNALLVDHYSAVVDRWDELDYDDVHPNYDGYEEIAKNWHNTLISLIPPSTVNMGALKLLLLE